MQGHSEIDQTAFSIHCPAIQMLGQLLDLYIKKLNDLQFTYHIT